MDMKYIALCIAALVMCIAVVVIISIRSKRITIDSIDDTADEDFIDVLSNKKRRSLARKPWVMSYKTYKTIATVSSLLLGISVFIATKSFLYTAIAAAVGLVVPEAIIMFQSNAQKSEFETRYATSLRQLVACLKSGLSIQQAVSDVCESPFVHDTIRAEYRRIDADIKLGISIRDAFQSFADRVDSEDAKDVAIAIAMQSKVGGREAETIESIAKNISDRLMLRKEITSMFAGSKMTVLSMDILPFVIVIFMYFGAPEYLAPFFESPMMMAVFFGLIGFMGIGSIFIHKSTSKMRKECGI